MEQIVLRTFIRFLFTITFLVFVLCSVAIASDLSLEGQSDWTMFQYNAQHTGYNDKDSITVPLQLLWKKRFLIEQHWIEPITAVGNRIIITNDRSYDYSPEVKPSVRCISALDGTELWSYENSAYSAPDKSQATYYNGNLFVVEVADESSRVAEYDIVTGLPFKWFLYQDQTNDQLGAIVHQNKLLFPAGMYNGIYCVDLADDSYLWWNDLPQIDLWSPSAVDTIVYTWTEDLITAHHLTKGGYLWWMIPQQYDTAKYPSTLFEVNSDLVSHGKNSHNSLSEEFALGPPFDWSGQNNAAAIDTTINMIYAFNHNGFYAVNYETKRRIWKINDYNYNFLVILSTPTICNGNVYNIFFDTLIALDGLTGTELWRYQLDTLTAYSTAIANGLIFASTQNKTIALDLNTHEKVWEYPAGGYLTIANNRLFIASITGDVYAFGKMSTDLDENISTELPNGFMLSQNYPNPFNPETEISFTIPEKTDLKLRIYNILGEEVRLLTDKQFSVGSHTITWDGTDNYGKAIVSGVYFYTLETAQYKSSKKMILLK